MSKKTEAHSGATDDISIEKSSSVADGSEQRKGPSEQLLMFDVGEWPTYLTLRREDEYGDDGR